MKTILYLDQNYLSDLTRERLSMKPRRTYSLLWEHLMAAVQGDVLVCPFSQSRRTESELLPSDREGGLQERDLYETAGEVHCGVEFREFPEVLRAQVRISLKRFLGAVRDVYEPLDGFTNDPHEPCAFSNPPLPRAGRFTEWTRAVKEYHENKGLAPSTYSFSEVKRVEAMATIENLYIRPVVGFLTGSADVIEFAALD